MRAARRSGPDTVGSTSRMARDAVPITRDGKASRNTGQADPPPVRRQRPRGATAATLHGGLDASCSARCSRSMQCRQGLLNQSSSSGFIAVDVYSCVCSRSACHAACASGSRRSAREPVTSRAPRPHGEGSLSHETCFRSIRTRELGPRATLRRPRQSGASARKLYARLANPRRE